MKIFIEVEKKDPLEGRAGDGEHEVRFHGWLDLLRVLSDLLEDGESPVSSPPAAGALARNRPEP